MVSLTEFLRVISTCRILRCGSFLNCHDRNKVFTRVDLLNIVEISLFCFDIHMYYVSRFDELVVRDYNCIPFLYQYVFHKRSGSSIKFMGLVCCLCELSNRTCFWLDRFITHNEEIVCKCECTTHLLNAPKPSQENAVNVFLHTFDSIRHPHSCDLF